jgi:Fe2+ or Zn2+ uptake regulation protein
MSFLTKSLEKRIQELRTSIEAQTTELAAYEQVLALETGKPAEVAIPPAAPVPSHPPTSPSSTDRPITVEFNGSRSDFVAAVLQQRGSAGVTPREIADAFRARKVAISKNLVYNVLSLLFKRKSVRKSGGRYYLVAAKAAAKAAPPAAPSPATKKHRISEEGMRRIIAATKKRWALQRAAKAKSR